MTTARDDLAALLIDALDQEHEYVSDINDDRKCVIIDGTWDLTEVADFILAAGWRAPKREVHDGVDYT
jgi:hypothetical protein